MAYLPNREFKELSDSIHKSSKPVILTSKELLSYFGVTIRKTNVIWSIDKVLRENDLLTVPSYKSGWIHSKIELTTEKILAKGKQDKEEDTITQRIKLLKSANTLPLFISKNDSVEKAMTIMMENDYSQLPVMNNEKSLVVDGMISWHSIGWKKALGRSKKTVLDYMHNECTVIKDNTPLLDAVEIIKKKEVVLIQKNDRTICGLVTITDIAAEFHSLAEPFFIIGQIEASIREILNNKFTTAELSAIKYSDDDREILSVSDLTFNEYIELIRKDDNWVKLNLPLDKKEFTKRLVDVRNIRNEVMHFNADNIDDEQKYLLRKTAVFLREILN